MPFCQNFSTWECITLFSLARVILILSLREILQVSQKSVELKCIKMNEEISAILLASGALKKFGLTREPHQLDDMVSGLNPGLPMDFKQTSDQMTLQSDPSHAQNPSAWFEAFWNLVCDLLKPLERHSAGVAQHITLAPDELAHGNSYKSAFRPILSTGWDSFTEYNLHAKDMHRSRGNYLQRNYNEFIFNVLITCDLKSCSSGSMHTSDHCNVVMSVVGESCSTAYKVVAQGLHHARILSKLWGANIFTVGGSLSRAGNSHASAILSAPVHSTMVFCNL